MRTKLEKEFEISVTLRVIIIICLGFFSYMAISYSIIGLFPKLAKDVILGDYFPKAMYFYRENLLLKIDNNRVYYLIAAFIYLFIIFGLILMYKGSWLGFIFFSTSEIILLIIPILVLGTRGIALGDIMIGALLIIFFLVEISKAKLRFEKAKKINNKQ